MCIRDRRYIGPVKEHCVWLSRNPKLGSSFFQSIKRMGNIDEVLEFLDKLESLNKIEETLAFRSKEISTFQ